MVKDPEVKRLDLTSVQAVMCSGAALSEETIRGLKDVLGSKCGILNGYGMTEGTVTLLRESRQDKADSIGRLSAGVSARVVDDCLNDVRPGAEGECLVKGPSVFLAYKGNEKATQKAKTEDGWLKTGDIVKVDDDGFFFLTGRKKELIKYHGNQISPVELEAVLLTNVKVLDAGVCGVFDKKLSTEIPIGFVKLASEAPDEGQNITLESIRAFVNSRVAPYKKFRKPLLSVEQLPRNSSGKLLRKKLEEMANRQEFIESKL
jgi:acyl-coenzyme A synthetase/AMP-(fatty) acid ligase